MVELQNKIYEVQHLRCSKKKLTRNVEYFVPVWAGPKTYFEACTVYEVYKSKSAATSNTSWSSSKPTTIAAASQKSSFFNKGNRSSTTWAKWPTRSTEYNSGMYHRNHTAIVNQLYMKRITPDERVPNIQHRCKTSPTDEVYEHTRHVFLQKATTKWKIRLILVHSTAASKHVVRTTQTNRLYFPYSYQFVASWLADVTAILPVCKIILALQQHFIQQQHF